MRDIIMNAKDEMSLHPRLSFESGRTEQRQSPPRKNGQEGATARKPAPPAPVGFWDPSLRKTRWEVCKAWFKTSELQFRADESC